MKDLLSCRTASKEVVSPSFKLCAKHGGQSLNSRRSAWTKRSPRYRGTYSGEGDQTPVSWNNKESDDPTQSPNSTASSGNCGASVWPTVRQDGIDNKYTISL